MTNRPTFKLHDDFNFEHKKIGDLSRETVERENRFEINESGRQVNETSRQVNELVREENELARESAESARVANEEERITKDSERDSKIEAFVEDMNDRIDNKADASELELYAKKEREDWITPTMINGWIGSTVSGQRPVRYMKDNMGTVHVSGSLEGGAERVMFRLPVGYRPNNGMMPVYAKPQWGHSSGVWLQIDAGGQVMIASPTMPTTTSLFFSCSFYAG